MKSIPCAFASILFLSFTTCFGAAQAESGSVEVNDKTISVSGSGYKRTFPCNGRQLEVAGSGHVISTTGECSSVDVSGAENTVDVVISPQGTLAVSGTSNTERWKSSGKIKQDVSGADHKVARVK